MLVLPLVNPRERVTLLSGSREVASLTLESTEADAPPWMPFELGPALKELRLQDPDDPADAHAGLSNPSAGIAVPASHGLHPIAAPADLDRPLPHLLPEAPEEGFTLTRVGGRLRVASTKPFLVYRPDFHFLGRWWINGRPFIPPPDRSYEAQNGIVIEGRVLSIDLEFLPARCGAKPGDRIGLQLLYGDDGWQFVQGGAELAAPHGTTPRAWLTNRIEWTVP